MPADPDLRDAGQPPPVPHRHLNHRQPQTGGAKYEVEVSEWIALLDLGRLRQRRR
jgi:hypothetical protein